MPDALLAWPARTTQDASRARTPAASRHFAIGGAVHLLEWPLFYVLFPVLAFFAMPDEATRALFRSNLVLQLCIFLPWTVQLPTLVTSRMASAAVPFVI